MANETKPGFEDALARIEKIVADLERGEPALSAALAKYEDGVKLLRQCYQLLEEAEQSVAILTGVDDQGNPLMVPFDATATLAREPGAAASPVSQETNLRPTDRNSASLTRSPAREDRSDLPDAPF
jgi:exodeoxyribonuclease VII small subunit